MEISVIQRIQRSLVDKRKNLGAWLVGAPANEQQVRLGPTQKQGLQEHLEVIETALEKAEECCLGVCVVCHEMVEPSLLEMDYTADICMEHLSAQERRGLEAELEFTRQVQQALLPQQVPQIPGLSLAVFSRPAQFVSGDYFDFLEFGDGAAGLAIADAMGHGISASMIMTSLQTALRTLVPESRSAVEVLERVNRYYLHNSHFTTFVSVFLGQYRPEERMLTYCNAGHNPPALYRRQERRIEWLKPTGAAIGLSEEKALRSGTVRLAEGDVILLYTDGVTEATNAQQEAFGNRRLAEALLQGADLPSGELVRSVRLALQEFTNGGPLADDVTLVAGKMEG
jgi:sigma-B regulation protein RsbU (phosphoserine phosphatase)